MVCQRFSPGTHRRRAWRIKRYGQPAKLEVDLLDGIVVVLVKPRRGFTHLVKDWRACVHNFGEYHISIVERELISDDEFEVLKAALHGRSVRLRIDYVADGGYMELSKTDRLHTILREFHSRGCYSARELHISG
jgi:hypothetical protein